MSTLAPDFKELVRSRTDLASLIGETVPLQPQRGGQEYIGVCPFHDDHRPSMRVYPDRQSFRCWACNNGGDCFTFVMLRERVDFREALEILATRANLEMPRFESSRPTNEATSKPRLYEVLGWAEQQFHQCLLNAPEARPAREYLASRQITPEMIAQFRLGYHPNNWEWLQRQAKGKYGAQQLLAARLTGENRHGGFFDYFVDRVLFPIHDAQGRPIAFGGRILPSGDDSKFGKYFNSLESEFFPKSRTLFGLDFARDAIKETSTTIVVEGYTDCIMAHQFGVKNVVATLGTSLTDGHVSLLKRFSRKVVLVYDGDRAGQDAAEKALARFLAQEVDLRILTLPEGEDPADNLLREGAEGFLTRLETAPEVWEYKFRLVMDRVGLDTVDAEHQVLEEMLEMLCYIPVFAGTSVAGAWQVREDLLLGKLAQRLSLPEKRVRQRLSELRQQNLQRKERDQQTRPPSAQQDHLERHPSPQEQIERELLEIAFTNPELVSPITDEITPEEFLHPQLRELWRICRDLSKRRELSFERVLSLLEEPALKRTAVFLDEQGHRKRIQQELLDQVLKCFAQRRDLAATQSRRSSEHGGMHRDVKAALKQANELNLKKHTQT